MARKAAQNAHQKGSLRNRPTTPSKKAAPRPITLAGIDEVPTTDVELGAPDAMDLAETARPMSPRSAKELALAAGDLDASFHGLESGEEAPGGSNPLPDQDDVDRIGAALGVVEQDEKPLATTEKIEGRDRERWELDPASAEDFEERQRTEPPPRRRRQR
jgi:hypothetical protein